MELVSDNNTGYVPLYRQIKRLITESLVSGEWAPGSPIPSEMELAQRYSVSQGTVRKAVSELASQKILVRHQGKGTFVASHSQESTKFPFLRITPDSGEGSSGWLIRRILAPEGEESIYEEIRLPGSSFETIEESMIHDHQCMLYSMYESIFNVRIVYVEERVKAIIGEGEIVDRLGLLDGAPLLKVERVAYTYDDRPVELRRSYCNTTKHSYRNKII